MLVKDKLYTLIIVALLVFLSMPDVNAQDEVVVRPKNGVRANPPPLPKNAEKKPLTPEEKYRLAWERHLSLQDERTRMRILHDIKMTNDYYDKQKESKFVKWVKRQKFKLKRKGIL
ncbi:MAG: hypothetical protein ACP5PZ_06360 [Bacteroidales bacterium]